MPCTPARAITQAKRAYAEREVLLEMTAVRECAQWAPRLHQCFQDVSHLWLVLEYLPGGDLLSLLQRRGVLREAEALFYACEIVAAVGAVHSLGFIHRDVKPDNIVIDASGHLKLADFGLTRSMHPPPKRATPQRLTSPAKSADGRWRSNSLSTGFAFARPSRGFFGRFVGGGSASAATSSAAIGTPTFNAGSYTKQSSPSPLEGGRPQPPSALSRRKLAYSIVGTPNYVAPGAVLFVLSALFAAVCCLPCSSALARDLHLILPTLPWRNCALSSTRRSLC